jgi:hypothetical protein
MIYNDGKVSVEISFSEGLKMKEDLNAVGCSDKVEVEHIRNGRVIYSDEEK